MKAKFMRSILGVFLVAVGALVLNYAVVKRDVRERLARAQATRAEFDISHISAALDLYRSARGEYPASLDGLEAERFLASLPIDPWGKPYIYRVPGRSDDFEVFTLGADGKEGGSGTNADLGTWTL